MDTGENYETLKIFIEVLQFRRWNVAHPLSVTNTMSVSRGLGSWLLKPCILKNLYISDHTILFQKQYHYTALRGCTRTWRDSILCFSTIAYTHTNTISTLSHHTQSWNQYLKVVYYSSKHSPTVLLSIHHI